MASTLSSRSVSGMIVMLHSAALAMSLSTSSNLLITNNGPIPAFMSSQIRPTCSSTMTCFPWNIKRRNVNKYDFHEAKTTLRSSKPGAEGDYFNYKESDDEGAGDYGELTSSNASRPPASGNFFSSDQEQSISDDINLGGPGMVAPEEEPPMTLEELEMLASDFDEDLPKINTVSLVGRVGASPSPRYFDDGKVVLNLSLAVKRKYHPLERKVRGIASGEEETDWFTLEIWGRDAEYATKYVEKGARIGVTGSLVMDGWIDKQTGEQRRKAKVVVRHLDILESRAEAQLRKEKSGNSWSGGGKGGYGGGGKGRYSGGGGYDDDDDDGGPSPAGTGGFFS